MSEMHDIEIQAVREMEKTVSQRPMWNALDRRTAPFREKRFDLVQFRNVLGLSKTFRPTFTIGKGARRTDVGSITSALGFAQRTSVYKTIDDNKVIGVWYLRIRRRLMMTNPLEGIVKVERYAIDSSDQEEELSPIESTQLAATSCERKRQCKPLSKRFPLGEPHLPRLSRRNVPEVLVHERHAIQSTLLRMPAMQEPPIGKVTATERSPTSCSTVHFWVHEDVVIRPFDIVRIPHLQGSLSYAIVKDLAYITDSAGHLANFVSSDFGQVEAEPQNVRMGTTIAEAEILYNTKDIEMPVRDGAKVEWADIDGIRNALGLGAFRNPIPAGYICMSNGLEIPVEFEGKYLLGPEGAHLNIAGISGLATKTTYAMFLMNSIQQRLDGKVTMIVFNVKGTDLLAIDEPSTEALTPQQEEEWKKCGLSPTPFKNVTYLYPFRNQAEGGTRSPSSTSNGFVASNCGGRHGTTSMT